MHLYLKIAEEVLEGSAVGNHGGFMATVNCSHQREGEVQNVAIQKRTPLFQQHCQQLQETKSRNVTLFICL